MPAAHDFLERLESGTAEACSQPAPDTLETQLPLTGSAAATFLDSVECAESYPVSSAAVDPAEGANTLTASPACPAALPASGGCGETAGHSVAATAPQTPELEGTAALIGYPASEGIAAAAAGVAAAAVLAADLEIATASAAESGGGEAEAAGALLTSRSSMQTSLAGVASPHATEVPTIEFALHELRLDDEQWGVLDGAGISELWIDLRLVVLPQPWRSGRVRFPTRRTPGGVLALKLSSAAGQLDFPHDSSAASVLRNALIADDVDASSVVLSLHGARGGAGDVGARLAEATLSLRQMARSMPLPAHALPARAHCPHTRCARTRSPNTRCSEARYPHLPASASICSVGWWRTTSGVTAQRVLPSVHRAAHAASLTITTLRGTHSVCDSNARALAGSHGLSAWSRLPPGCAAAQWVATWSDGRYSYTMSCSSRAPLSTSRCVQLNACVLSPYHRTTRPMCHGQRLQAPNPHRQYTSLGNRGSLWDERGIGGGQLLKAAEGSGRIVRLAAP